jgi:phage gpG-like protein
MMENGISYSVTGDELTLRVNREFAYVHQRGTSRAGRNRKVTIPARPILGLSDADIDGIERTIVRVLEGRIT